MAEETIVTNIVAKSNFSDLIGDLNKVSTRLSTLQTQLATTNRALANQAAQMQKSFAATLRSTGQFSTHFVSLASDVDKFGKSLDSGQLKLGQYYNAWKEHSKTAGGLIRDLAKQQVQMQNAILQPLGRNAQGLMQFNVHVPQGLDEIKNKSKIASQELKIMNKVIQDGANQVINWGKNTQWAGRQLTMGLTLPIAAFGAAAQKAFLEADQQLVRLTKVYGGVAQTSAAELKKVRTEVSATARDLAKTYGASYKDTISLAADIAATGKTGNELLKSTAETTRLSILGEVDRQEAMKATLAIQTAFKQNTTQLGESINFLNAVENQTSTSLQDLVEAIPKAGPVIQAMGGSIKDLALYMTAMKEGGISASEGANALKSAMASLVNPTKVAKDMFAGFGIDLAGIVTKNAGNLTATILELQGALDNLNPLQKQQAIEQLFGKFQFARMNALFANLGKQGSQTLQVLDLMKASSKDLANIASREMTQMTESASGRYKRALETLKADMAGVGDSFLNVSTRILNVLDKIINFFNHLPKPIKAVATFIGGLTAIAGPIIMLTGLLANFFGYIAKGVFHFKSFLKGGEGFKLLTPEILAAEQAGSLMEKTFYSDAKAAAVLKQALAGLTAELSILQTKANSGVVSIGPAIQTAAGAVLSAGQEVRVDKTHPLVGQPYTRQMAHLVPKGTQQPETIFGVVPNPGPVNQKIGKNLQMYAGENMPRVEGLSAIRGVSTGIIPQEAAKWHAMNGALAMQSEAELKALRAEVHRTNTVSTSVLESYQALLPEMTSLTKKAADESAIIVGELEAGKITVDTAKARITALNVQIETMMGEVATGIATTQGRSIDLKTVPLTRQPVVDPLGRSNMKELFHKGSTKNFVDSLAGILGVRTSGAGYSRETTFPRVSVAPFLKRNSGGQVYTLDKGPVVPGPATDTTDTQYGLMPEGSFVVNKDAAKNPPPAALAQFLNNGGRTRIAKNLVPVMLTPGEKAYGPDVVNAQTLPLFEAWNSGKQSNKNGMYNQAGSVDATPADIIDVLKGVKGRGRQYKAYALLTHAGIPVDLLQNSAYPGLHSENLQTRGGGKILGANYVSMFDNPNVFSLANKVLSKYNLPLITEDQRKIIHERLLNSASSRMLTEAEFGRHLTQAYINAGVSVDSIKALADEKTMRFSLPGKGTNKQKAEALAKLLTNKYSSRGGKFVADTNGNIKVSFPGVADFKIEHEATRALHSQLGGYSYETQRQGLPLDPVNGKKQAYTHLPLDTSLFDKPLTSLPKNPLVAKFPSIYTTAMHAKTNVPISKIMVRQGNGFGTLKALQAPRLTGIELAVERGLNALRSPAMRTRLNSGGIINGYALGGLVGGLKNHYGTQVTDTINGHTFKSVEEARRIARLSVGNPSRIAAAQQYLSMYDPRAMQAAAINGVAPKYNAPVTFKTRGSNTRDAGFTDWQMRGTQVAGIQPMYMPPTVTGMARSLYSSGSDTGLRAATRMQLAQIAAIDKLIKVQTKVSDVYYATGIKYEKLQSQLRTDIFAPHGLISRSMITPTSAKELFGSVRGFGSAFAPRLDEFGRPIKGTRMGYRALGFSGENPFAKHPMLTSIAATAGTAYVGQKVSEKNPMLGNIISTVGGTLAFMLPQMLMSRGPGIGKLAIARAMQEGTSVQSARAAIQAEKNIARIMARTGSTAAEAEQIAATGTKVGRFGTMGAKAVSIGSKIKAIPGVMALAQTNPYVLTAEAVLSIGQGLWVWKRHVEDVGKANRAVFGPTKASLKEVGIEYKSITDRVRSVISAQEDLKKKILSSGRDTKGKLVGGLTLTKDQLDKEVKRIKDSKSETVQDFNKTYGKSDVLRLAVSLKQQYISAGMSASEATNKVYAFMKASNKASYAFSAITSQAFKGITDQSTAADYAIKLVIKSIKSAKPEELATGVQNIVNSLDAYKTSLIGTKDANGKIIDEYKAQEMALDKIISLKGSENKLSSDTVDAIKKQDLYLGAVLSKNESLQGVYAKSSLLQGGFGSIMDIGAMSSADAVQAARGMEVWQKSVATTIGSVTGLSAEYERLGKSIASANKVQLAQDVQKSLENKIKLEDKLIQKIKEQTDARLKALDAEQQVADFNTSLKKEQLAYQNALATGDMTSAAQAQLNIQALVKQKQINDAKQSITDAANAKIKAAEVRKEGYQAQIDKGQNAVYTAQQKAQDNMASQVAVGNYLATVDSLLSRLTPGSFKPGDKDKNSPSYLAIEGIKTALQDLADSGSYGKKKAAEIQKQIDASTNGKLTGTSAWITTMLGKSQDTADKSGFPQAVSAFEAAVDKFAKAQGYSTYRAPDVGEYRKLKFQEDTTYEVFVSPSGKKVQISTPSESYESTFNKMVEKGYKFVQYAPRGINPDKATVYSDVSKVPAAKATGGYISGPGTSLSDSIPAMLSNGEYVINASSVSTYGKGFFDQINAKKYAMGGAIPGYAMGGSVDTRFASVSRPNYNMSSNSVSAYAQPSSTKVFQIAPVIHAAPGMDENTIVQMAVRQSVDAFKTLQYNESRAMGVGRLR